MALWAVGVMTGIYLLAPLVTVIAASFTSGEYITVPPQIPLSMRWYAAFFEDSLYQAALRNSIVIATATTAIALVVGTAAALGFTRRRFRGDSALYFLLFLPFLMPGIVLGMGLAAGLQPMAPDLLRGSYAIVVIGHLLWATPLVFVVMVARLREIDRDLQSAAQSLGATPASVFREITLPLAVPGLFAAGILAFVVSLHDFSMALFLTGPDTTTLPVLVWNALRFEVRPIIAAIDSLLVVTVVAALAALGRFVGLDKITTA